MYTFKIILKENFHKIIRFEEIFHLKENFKKIIFKILFPKLSYK